VKKSLRLLLVFLGLAAVSVVLDVVPVRAVEVPASGVNYLRCNLAPTPGDLTVLVSKCNYDVGEGGSGWAALQGTTQYHSGTSVNYTYVPYFQNLMPGGSGGQFFRMYIGPLTGTPYGDVPLGSFIGEVKHGYSVHNYGSNWYDLGNFSALTFDARPANGVVKLDTSTTCSPISSCVSAGFQGSNDDPVTLPFPTDWFPGGTGSEQPACTGFDITLQKSSTGGGAFSWVTMDASSVKIRNGDKLRIIVDGEYPPEDQSGVYFFHLRTTSAALWDLVGSYSTVEFLPQTFDYGTYYGSTLNGSEFSLRCSLDGSGLDYFWNIVDEWGYESQAPLCADYSLAYQADYGSGLVSMTEEGLIPEGNDWSVSVDFNGGYTPSQVNWDFRTDPGAGFVLSFATASPTVFPVTYTRPADGAFQGGAIEVRCTPAGASSVWSNFVGDPWSPSPWSNFPVGGPNGEGCYSSSGTSLYKPWTWLAAGGRMATCLAVYLFVPSDPGVWIDGRVAILSERAPVSFATGVIEVADAVTEPGSGSTYCVGDISTQYLESGSICADLSGAGLVVPAEQQGWMLTLMIIATVFMGVFSLIWMLW